MKIWLERDGSIDLVAPSGSCFDGTVRMTHAPSVIRAARAPDCIHMRFPMNCI